MANTLTDLIPDLFQAMTVVSREQVGLIPACTRDGKVERAAVGQAVRSAVAPAATASDITPGVNPPASAGQSVGNEEVTITKARAVDFTWNGEESRGLDNNGPGVLDVQQQQIAQAIRTLTNEMEADLASEHVNFSRAFGTPGSTPFGTAGDFTDASNVLKILKDNGAPTSDNHLIINSTAGASMIGKQSEANKAGTDSMQRQGIILDQAGLAIRESAAIVDFTPGDASGATTDGSGYAVGDKVITLASTGSGAVLAGDVVTFAGDVNKYVVAGGDADVNGGGTVTLAAPGLRVAIGSSATAITVLGLSARNMAFNRSSLVLASRAPALPKEGDNASDRKLIQDPHSGLVFEISLYKQYRQVRWEIAAAWGRGTFNKQHTGLLLG